MNAAAAGISSQLVQSIKVITSILCFFRLCSRVIIRSTSGIKTFKQSRIMFVIVNLYKATAVCCDELHASFKYKINVELARSVKPVKRPSLSTICNQLRTANTNFNCTRNDLQNRKFLLLTVSMCINNYIFACESTTIFFCGFSYCH